MHTSILLRVNRRLPFYLVYKFYQLFKLLHIEKTYSSYRFSDVNTSPSIALCIYFRLFLSNHVTSLFK